MTIKETKNGVKVWCTYSELEEKYRHFDYRRRNREENLRAAVAYVSNNNDDFLANYREMKNSIYVFYRFN